jgi:hypothetical protein
MNSLRTGGVITLQAARAAVLAISAVRRSACNRCTNQPGSSLLSQSTATQNAPAAQDRSGIEKLNGVTGA